MDDTISRRAAIDVAKAHWYKPDIVGAIEQLPSAQPEIIRCKECENWDKSWTNDWEPNCHYCPMIDRVCGENWYCADAERRTDEID